MNTPAHAVVSLLVLGRRSRPELSGPIVLGAVLPDAPMFVFYVWEKLAAGTPERGIWSSAYFEPSWQAFFDVFNSLPLIALGLVAARAARAPRLVACLASMGVHALLDLPLHREDGHRHFFPLSDWRFMSPVSYWDPDHHGMLFGAFEVGVVVVGCAVLARRHDSRTARTLLGGVVAVYAFYVGYALLVWVPSASL